MIFRSNTFLQDLKSGLFVSLLALPLCLGISIASGFPPIAGIFSAVVGGIFTSFLGSAPLTIKGPAAGLIVIVIGAVTELGMGDPVLGYKRTLAVCVVAALVQIIFGLIKAGMIGEFIPKSVVHGMLSGIGLIIIAKQSHNILGINPIAKNPLELLWEWPTHLVELNPEITLIGGLTLFLLVFWPKIAKGFLKSIPAAIPALLVSMALGAYFNFDQAHDYQFLNHNYHVDSSFLINLPQSFFKAFVFPDFRFITSFISIKFIIMLSLVGSIESLLTVSAVDGFNPHKKSSDLNKDLIATGCGNLLSALIGGLPMISEIVRSKANIDNGAKSVQSNFFHGCFLLSSVALFPNLLHMIPATTLAAMLIFTGFRLASPKEFSHAYAIGMDQFVPFIATFILTITTDLLLGVFVGVTLQLLINIYQSLAFRDLFHLRHEEIKNEEGMELKVHGPIGFTNSYQFRKILERVIRHDSCVTVNFSQSTMVEHTCFHAIEMIRERNHQASIRIKGLEAHRSISKHKNSTKFRR